MALVFDTDVTTNLDVVKKNIENIKKYCRGVKIIYLLQVKKSGRRIGALYRCENGNGTDKEQITQ